MGVHPHSKYFEEMKPVLKSKAEEFKIIGYGAISIQDLWDFLINKKWKKVQEEMRMYELVSDILTIKIGDFMNYKTIEAYRSPNWFEDINEDELKELLYPDKTK